MASQLKNALLRTAAKPKPSEVWRVHDKSVVLHEKNRVDKIYRPVLVLNTASLLTIQNHLVVNVVPLSTMAETDRLCFPIAQSYCETVASFKPSDYSHAVIYFYQPIEIHHFHERCGKIDETAYQAIVRLLCLDVIGFVGYDLTP